MRLRAPGVFCHLVSKGARGRPQVSEGSARPWGLLNSHPAIPAIPASRSGPPRAAALPPGPPDTGGGGGRLGLRCWCAAGARSGAAVSLRSGGCSVCPQRDGAAAGNAVLRPSAPRAGRTCTALHRARQTEVSTAPALAETAAVRPRLSVFPWRKPFIIPGTPGLLSLL